MSTKYDPGSLPSSIVLGRQMLDERKGSPLCSKTWAPPRWITAQAASSHENSLPGSVQYQPTLLAERALPVSATWERHGNPIIEAFYLKKQVPGLFRHGGPRDYAALHWRAREYFQHSIVQPDEYHVAIRCKCAVERTSASAVVNPTAETTKIWQSSSVAPSDFAVGDVNGDGLDDIVIADSSNILIYINEGNGTFKRPVSLNFPERSAPCYVTLGNFAGNQRKLDIAVLSLDRQILERDRHRWSFSFLFNNGNGTFQDPIEQYETEWKQKARQNAEVAPSCQCKKVNFLTVPKMILVDGHLRDVASVDGIARWWNKGIQGLPWVLGN